VCRSWQLVVRCMTEILLSLVLSSALDQKQREWLKESMMVEVLDTAGEHRKKMPAGQHNITLLITHDLTCCTK